MPHSNFHFGNSPQARGLHVRCCKKHWDWIGHVNDTRKHPTRPRFAEDYNVTAMARIGWWGKMEDYTAQPPDVFDDNNVMWGAENCNAYPEEDVMRPLDEMDYIPSVMRTICSHMDDCNSYNAAPLRCSQLSWNMAFVLFWGSWALIRG